MGTLTVLPQEGALPGAQGEAAFAYRDGQLAAGQHGADVRRHIVRPLHCVDMGRVTVGRQLADEIFQVAANVRIGIFSDQQRSAGVPQKNVAQACRHATSGDNIFQLGADFLKPAPAGGNFNDGDL